MIYLLPNTAGQNLILTLDEGRTYFSTAFTNYLLILTREENSEVGESTAQVVTIIGENARYTTVQVSTVGITEAGTYRYEVYGQNSAVNIDPDDVSVVGLVERGWGKIQILGTPNFFEQTPNVIQPDFVNNATTE